MGDFYKPVAYGLLNIVSASGIVFANKAVMTTFGFHFIYALTLIHTITTLLGMKVFAYFGLYETKRLPKLSIAPLAASYVGYIVLNNLNLQMNTVGFYQISKIAVAPAVRTTWTYFVGSGYACHANSVLQASQPLQHRHCRRQVAPRPAVWGSWSLIGHALPGYLTQFLWCCCRCCWQRRYSLGSGRRGRWWRQLWWSAAGWACRR